MVTYLRKLRRYLFEYFVVIRIYVPLKHILYRPDLVGHLTKWVIELSTFEVSFAMKNTLKASLFANFLAEMTLMPLEPDHTWVVFMDGSSNSLARGATMILENGLGVVVEVSLRFEFPTTNNQVEYEAVITWITLVGKVGIDGIKL